MLIEQQSGYEQNDSELNVHSHQSDKNSAVFVDDELVNLRLTIGDCMPYQSNQEVRI